MTNIFFAPFKHLLSDNSLSIDVVFFSFLLIFIPIVLITGPALPDIFLSLIALYFLIKSFYQKLWHYYQNPIVIGFLLFSGYGILRSILSEMPIKSLTNEGSVFYFRYIFFAMGTWYLLDKNPHLKKCILTTSLICLFVVSFDGIYQYIMDLNLFGNKKHAINRLTGLMGKEPIIGRYTAYLSIFTFALVYPFIKTKNMIMLSVVFLVITEIVVFLSGERSPLFSITQFSFLIILFIPNYRLYRIGGLFISIIIILGILEVNPVAKKRMIDQTIQQMSETQYPFLPYSSSHELHYISGLTMFKSLPLFGVGTNTYRFQSQKTEFNPKKVDIHSHPHNFYIQSLAELGIVGFLFLIAFFSFLSYFIIRQMVFVFLKNKSKQLPFERLIYVLVLFVYWWPIIPHMSFYNNWNNVLIMLPLGFFMKYFYGRSEIN